MNGIVIFGGSGFVGTNLIKYLLEKNVTDHIYIADIKKPRDGTMKNVTYCYVDVREPIDEKLFDGTIQSSINLAAIHTTPGHPTHEYFETNIKGAVNICNFAEKRNINKIVFTSSISVYGPGEDEKEENSLPMPAIPYGSSKIISEYIHKEWYNRNSKRMLAVLRPAVIFGKFENGNFTRIAHALQDGIFVYPGRKDTIKSCVYVKDICRYILWRLKNSDGFFLNNLCYPEKINIKTICDTFSKTLHYKKARFSIPLWSVNTIAACLKRINIPYISNMGLDPERIIKLVKSTNISSDKLIREGFQFKYTLKDALLDWYKECKTQRLY